MLILIDKHVSSFTIRVKVSSNINKKKNMIKKSVSQLLEAEMDRKDFLKLVGLGAVAATGLTQILKVIAQQTPTQRTVSSATGAQKSQAYGSMPYGGNATSNS
jgi:hypothetical protein